MKKFVMTDLKLAIRKAAQCCDSSHTSGAVFTL